MPYFDKTGPYGQGPKTGRGFGPCAKSNFGQESPSEISYIESEREPNEKELALWNKSRIEYQRVNQLSYALKLQYINLGLIHKYSINKKINLETDEDLAALETRMFGVLSEIERLKDDMCGVEQLELGIRISENGDDLDIIQPTAQQLGWVIPAVIGAVIVVGIIARWAYLEKEVNDISLRYNGVLHRANESLCSDPNSATCIEWKETKKSGGYYKRESVIDKIKKAASKIGSTVTTGLGAGLAIAIPLLMLIYLPRRKDR